ncbi:MerR family transcriptional regulator [Pendulispora brunnea]|uniref:MerR family transcriptional regulator n=1 Tax=Pendulispora brunnea TaxID=2905690 RepID=A0ABZ2KCG8_9BACT
MTLSIGAFSRLTGLSVKALRLYDAARILRPAEVDRANGYRRYRLAQLVDAQRILTLRQMGMPLVGVRRGSTDRGSLLSLRDTLQAQMEALASQLSAVNEALASTSLPDAGSAPAVVVKRVPSMRVIAKRYRLGHQGEADALLDSLFERDSAAISGTIWHDCGSRSGNVDAQVFLVPKQTKARPDATTLPGLTCASCLVGADDFDLAYRALSHWRRRRGHRQAGPYRELYYRDENNDGWLEVQLPVTPASDG